MRVYNLYKAERLHNLVFRKFCADRKLLNHHSFVFCSYSKSSSPKTVDSVDKAQQDETNM